MRRGPPRGCSYIIELAELLQAAVVDTIQRMNFPSRHPLSQDSSVLRSADVVLALEHPLLSRSSLKPGAKLLSISSFDLFTRSNYWHFGRYQEADLPLAADAEATLPALIEEVKRLITPDRRRAFDARRVKLAEAHQQSRERNRVLASHGWDDSPISTARIAAELWEQIKNKDWSLVSRSDGMSEWAWRLWKFEKYYHHIGQSGSVGVGYSNPGVRGRGAGEPEIRPAVHQPAERWRLHVPAGDLVDGGASSRSRCSPSCTTTGRTTRRSWSSRASPPSAIATSPGATSAT